MEKKTGRRKMEEFSEEGREKLANGIILQAVKDYREALKRLKKKPHDRDAQAVKGEVELFFHSPWYAILTDVDSGMLIRKLGEEADRD